MSACRQHCWHRMAYAHAVHADDDGDIDWARA